MSVTVQYGNVNYLNLPETTSLGIDVITRGTYFATIVGYQAGLVNAGYFNCIFGHSAAKKNVYGKVNVYFGTNSAESAISADDNVFLGNFSGQYLTTGSSNTYIGNMAGQYTNGNNNIFIGSANNTQSNAVIATNQTISIGSMLNTTGLNNIIMGTDTYVQGNNCIVLGNDVIHSNNNNSILIGDKIFNTGSNCLIIRNKQVVDDRLFQNSNDNYVNIQDILFTTFGPSNKRYINLAGGDILMSTSNFSLQIPNTQIVFNDKEVTFSNQYGDISINSNQTILMNQISSIVLNSNISLSNMYSGLLLSSNTVSLTGSNSYLVFNSNSILLGGNAPVTISNALNVTSNLVVYEKTWLSNDVSIAGNTFLSNSLYVKSNVYIGNTLTTNGIATFQSNVFMKAPLNVSTDTDGIIIKSSSLTSNALSVDGNISFSGDKNYLFINNSNVIVKSPITLCNIVKLTSNLSVKGQTTLDSDVNIYGKLSADSNFDLKGILTAFNKSTFCNDVNVYGKTNFYSNVNIAGLVTISNVKVTGTSEFEGDVVMKSNVTVLGSLTVCNVQYITSNVTIYNNEIIHDNLVVYDNTTLCNDLDVYGNVRFHGSNVMFDSFVQFSNNVLFESLATFSNEVVISSNLSTYGDTLLNGSNLYVAGVAKFSNDVIFESLATFSNEVVISSNVYIHGDVRMFSNLFVDGILTVSKINAETINGGSILGSLTDGSTDISVSNLNVNYDALIQSNLDVYGDVAFHSDTFTINGKSFTDIISELGGNTISGDVNTDSLSIKSNLEVNGDAIFNGSNIIIDGKTIINSNVDIQGDLSVFQDLALSSNLDVYGDVRLHGSNIIIDGKTIINSNVEIYGSFTCDSNVFIKGSEIVIGDVSTFGNVLNHKNLDCLGSFIAHSNIDIYGNALFNSNVIINGSLSVSNLQYVNCNVIIFSSEIIHSNLHVFNAATLCNLYVIEKTTLCNDVKILGPLILDSNLDVYGDITFHGSNLFIDSVSTFKNDVSIASNLDVYGNVSLFGSNIYIENSIILNSNFTISNLGNVDIYGEGVLDMQQQTYIKDLVIYGSITLSNEGRIYGFPYALITSNFDCDSNYIIWSNIEGDFYDRVDGSQVIDQNLYVGGCISSRCVSAACLTSSTTRLKDVTLYGKIQFSNTAGTNLLYGGIFSMSSSNNCRCCSDEYIDWSNFKGSELHLFEGTVKIKENLYVGGCIFAQSTYASYFNITTIHLQTEKMVTNEINFTDKFNLNCYWSQYVDVIEPGKVADFIFMSKNGTSIVFTDDFQPSVLNFTGSHRLVYKKPKKLKKSFNVEPGMLVISTGKYRNLQGEDKCTIDEALPVVTLSKRSKDKRVLGIIGDMHSDTNQFKIGNIQFKNGSGKDDKRYLIQTTGEGLIWVTGRIRNGDLICTSDLPGYGRLQDDDIVRNYSVAKATCGYKSSQKKKNIIYKGRKYTCYLIGCIYLC